MGDGSGCVRCVPGTPKMFPAHCHISSDGKL